MGFDDLTEEQLWGNATSEEFVACYLGKLVAAQEAVMELLDSS